MAVAGDPQVARLELFHIIFAKYRFSPCIGRTPIFNLKVPENGSTNV